MSAADDAVLTILRANLARVHDGHVTDSDDDEKTISAPLPYVVYFTTPGYPIGGRLGTVPRGRVQEFQVTGVGSTREQAMWAGDRAEAALDGTLVTVDGRNRRVRRDTDNPIVWRDPTWTRPDGGPLFNDVRRYTIHR